MRYVMLVLLISFPAFSNDFSLIPTQRPTRALFSCSSAVLLNEGAAATAEHNRFGLAEYQTHDHAALDRLATLSDAEIHENLIRWISVYHQLTHTGTARSVQLTLLWIFDSFLPPQVALDIKNWCRETPYPAVAIAEQPPRVSTETEVVPTTLLASRNEAGASAPAPETTAPLNPGDGLVQAVNISVVLMPDPRDVAEQNRRATGFSSRGGSPHRGSILPAHNYDRNGHLVDR